MTPYHYQKVPPVLNTERFSSLDGFRAVCIILVVSAHISNAFHINPYARAIITQIGLLGVQIFFVISGFLITSLLLKEKIFTGSISLKNFYIRRSLRILPVALLYLLCLFFLTSIFHLDIPVRCFIGAVLFLSNIAFFQGSWYTAHFWSLAVEEQYYLIFPLLLKRFTNYIHYVLLAVILLIVFIRETSYLGIKVFPDTTLFNTIGSVLLQSDGVLTGSLISVLCFQNKISFGFFKKNNLILNILLPVLIFFIFCCKIQLYTFNSLVCSFLIGVLIVCNINQDTIFSGFLNNRYIVAIGKLSYSIYIWQQLFSSTNGKLGVLSSLPLNIALIALVSYCSYHFFEKRFLQLKNKFYSRGK